MADSREGNAPDDRREGMRRAARRRAEHYAYFQEEPAENVHVGGEDARTLGPWSSARQLVDERERARANREEQIKRRKKEEEGLVAWKPRADRQGGSTTAVRKIPSLFEFALQVLCDHFDAVESLEGIPDVVRAPIAAELSRRRTLTPQTLPVLVAGYPTELLLSNCTLLDQATMVDAFKGMGISRLQRMELQFCGRGFGDSAVEAILQQGKSSLGENTQAAVMPLLEAISLSGAYRLSDKGLRALVESSPSLKSLKLESCTRVADGGSTCLSALCGVAESLEVLSLKLCDMDDNNLLHVLPKLQSLQHLELDGQPYITDTLICEIAANLPLKSLHLAGCRGVTDDGVVAVASFCPMLESIVLDDLPKVSDRGVVALAEGCKHLKRVSLRQCTGVSASALSQLVASGGITELNITGIKSVDSKFIQHLTMSCLGSLSKLDLSWCRMFHEDALGHLVDACTFLEELTLFGCSQITQRLCKGHSNPRVTIHGR